MSEMGFDSRKKRTLSQGFFESEKAFSERVLKAGNQVVGSQAANARRTLDRIAADDRKRRDAEKRKKTAQEKRAQEGRISAQRLRDARAAKKARENKNKSLNGWLD